MNVPITVISRRPASSGEGVQWIGTGRVENDKSPVRISLVLSDESARRAIDSLVTRREPYMVPFDESGLVEVVLELGP